MSSIKRRKNYRGEDNHPSSSTRTNVTKSTSVLRRVGNANGAPNVSKILSSIDNVSDTRSEIFSVKRKRDANVNYDVTIEEHGRQSFIISRLPNEMLRAILFRVQLPHLIRFCSVNKRWKLVIEDICRYKKCLVVVDWLYEHYLNTLSSRFNGYLKLNHSNVVFIRIDHRIRLSSALCPILAQLFPQIEQFATNVELLYSSPKFISMLRKWSPSLSALSLSNPITASLYAQISKMSNLHQLHLDYFDRGIADKLTPTLNRLKHLSFRVYDQSIGQIISFLGITSLALLDSNLTIKEVGQWRNANAQFVSSLERLSFFTYDLQVLPFICKHFTSLQMLQIGTSIVKVDTIKFTAETIKHLARLTNLTELRFESFVIDLHSLLDVAANFRPLHNIRVLSLVDFTFVSSNYDATRVSRVLSIIFPNVGKLVIKSHFYKMLGYSLESQVKLFPNLRTHDFGLDDPI